MEHDTTHDTLDLRDYLAVVRRRWRTIVGVTVVTLAVALAVSFTQQPMYEASTELVVVPVNSDDSLEQLLSRQAGMGTQARLATSVVVAERVVDQLGLELDPYELSQKVQANPVRDTNVLELSITWSDPVVAAQLVESFADQYLRSRQSAAQEGRSRARAELDAEVDRVEDRIAELDDELSDARAADDTDGERTLVRERDTLLTQLGQLMAERTAASTSDLGSGDGGEVIVPARVPERPVSPKPLRTGVLALVLGMMLGVGLAFLRDFLDDAVRSDDDLRRATDGRPVLGHMPRYGGGESTGERPALPTLGATTSPAAEAARTLRSNIRFLAARDPLRSVVVTSPHEGEGKTTVASNLAVAAALAGRRVILVDADLRRPTVHKAFGADNLHGVSEVIVGELSVGDVVQDVGVPRLRLLTAGTRPPNPAELLGSPAFAKLIRELEQLADLVVIDTPPVLPVADTLEVAHVAIGTLVVVTAGASSRRSLRDATSRITHVGGTVLGTVMNRIEGGDAYYYAYGYGDPHEAPAPDAAPKRASAPQATGEPTAEAVADTDRERANGHLWSGSRETDVTPHAPADGPEVTSRGV